MRTWMQGLALFTLFSLGATGCIVTANAGRYIPDDRPEPRADPIELKVGVLEFTDRLGARTDDTRRLTESFLADLKSAGIYAEVVGSPDQVDVLLCGKALSLQQPISNRSMDNEAMGWLIPMTLSSLGVLPLLGVPTDCGEAKASIEVRALDPRFKQELFGWYGEAKARSCSGLYYRGWPLSKALSQATGKILEGMQRDAPKLENDLLALKSWHKKYSGPAVPSLIRALGDSDKRIRVRAVAALSELGPGALAAAPALVGCLNDEDPAVRREAIGALLAMKAVDDKTLSLLAELRRKGKSPHYIDRAGRALKFLKLSAGLPPDLARQVTALGSLDRLQRIKAAESIRSRDALPPLIEALKDPEPEVRLAVVAALEAIAAYDHPPANLALKQASNNDRDRRVKKAAKETLRRLELLALSQGHTLEKTVPARVPVPVPVPVSETTGPVVAVFVTQETLRHLKRGQLSDYLAVRLTSECGFRVVPQDQIKKHLFEEKKKTYRHCYDQRCRIELGKAVAAEKILAVRIFKTGTQCVVTASLYDLRTETTERAATTRVSCTDASLMSALDTVAHQLSSPRISRHQQ